MYSVNPSCIKVACMIPLLSRREQGVVGRFEPVRPPPANPLPGQKGIRLGRRTGLLLSPKGVALPTSRQSLRSVRVLCLPAVKSVISHWTTTSRLITYVYCTACSHALPRGGLCRERLKHGVDPTGASPVERAVVWPPHGNLRRWPSEQRMRAFGKFRGSRTC